MSEDINQLLADTETRRHADEFGPQDGNWTITPGKLWGVTVDAAEARAKIPLGSRPHASDCAVGPPGHNPFRDHATDRRRIGG